jgi:hypothetical protein
MYLIARTGETNAHKILVGKLLGMLILGGSRRRWKITLRSEV